MAQLAINPQSQGYFTLIEGDLRQHGRLYVGRSGGLRTKIMSAIHDSTEGGHSGINASIKRAELYFYWPSLRKDITEYIKQCETCQRNKREHVPTPRLLQPIPVPTQAWEVIIMDFIEGLPKSQGQGTILVVIDKFSKYCYLMSLFHPYSVTQMAQLVLDQVTKCMEYPNPLFQIRIKSL